jgi:threonine synthase
MNYQSTRDKHISVSASEAIAQGLSREGGLFVPESFPALAPGDIAELCAKSYPERAACVMSLFLPDFTRGELADCTKKAYGPPGFASQTAAPVHKLDRNTYFLELWHGPTCAFKDMALQLLPYLMTAALQKTGEKRDACILVATSGDTGKAALEGFRDVERTRIFVFYPSGGVSDVQKLQMTTQEGNNVGVCAVSGNFDDAQSGVKAIFSDESLRGELSESGFFLSSANSINWGRLLPQIVYYFSAYCDLINSGDIRNGEQINFCVPTGNFGNILAGYYAKKLGLPVNKLICASNKNDVLAEFIQTGVYNKNRDFYTTLSPSMDILISSNLERLLFDASGCDDGLISRYMKSLAETGEFTVSDSIRDTVTGLFYGAACDDTDTKQTIAGIFAAHGYLTDTHTAVAYKALEEYRKETCDNTPCVVVSTASPYKFTGAVLDALGEPGAADGLTLVDRLAAKSGAPVPAPLRALRGKPERHTSVCERGQMTAAVREFLGI